MLEALQPVGKMPVRVGLLIIAALLLAGCSVRETLVFHPAAADARLVPVFVGTTRTPDPVLVFGSGRQDQPAFARFDIAVPPGHTPGRIEAARHGADPETQFLVASRLSYPDAASFRADLASALRHRPAATREAVIYVHGFNNAFAEGVLRIAQLAEDFQIPGVAVHYSWPSAARPLNYAYDRDSVLFARDGLETLIAEVRAAGASRILLVGHSVGSALIMETLRQQAIARPGSVARDFAGVVLISPDIDVDVFRSQAMRIGDLPQPFGIFISKRDRALSLSARLTGQRNRLGNVENLDQVADLKITVVDVTEFSRGAGHFVPGDAPAVIRLFGRSGDLNAAFRGDSAGRTGLLPGTVLTVQNLTAIILSPVTDLAAIAAQ